MAVTPEGKVKDLVKRLLVEFKAWYTMVIPSSYGNSTGLPDFTVVYRGRALFIETKAPGKKPTPLQNLAMQRITDAGGKCFVVDGPESLRAVREWLEEV